MKLPTAGLYAIADTATITGDLTGAVAAAITGGATLIQYRDKTGERERRQRDARQLAQLCHRAGVALIVNDDVELAATCGADGVHVGAEDTRLADARALLPEDAIIGVSCYDSLTRAQQAARDGADYIAFGSFYPSPTKPDAVRAPVELLTAARALPASVVAIGGITPDNGAALVDAGADFLAVISGIFASPDIQHAAESYAALFDTIG